METGTAKTLHEWKSRFPCKIDAPSFLGLITRLDRLHGTVDVSILASEKWYKDIVPEELISSFRWGKVDSILVECDGPHLKLRLTNHPYHEVRLAWESEEASESSRYVRSCCENYKAPLQLPCHSTFLFLVFLLVSVTTLATCDNRGILRDRAEFLAQVEDQQERLRNWLVLDPASMDGIREKIAELEALKTPLVPKEGATVSEVVLPVLLVLDPASMDGIREKIAELEALKTPLVPKEGATVSEVVLPVLLGLGGAAILIFIQILFSKLRFLMGLFEWVTFYPRKLFFLILDIVVPQYRKLFPAVFFDFPSLQNYYYSDGARIRAIGAMLALLAPVLCYNVGVLI